MSAPWRSNSKVAQVSHPPFSIGFEPPVLHFLSNNNNLVLAVVERFGSFCDIFLSTQLDCP
jgi:hypothetical protein